MRTLFFAFILLSSIICNHAKAQAYTMPEESELHEGTWS